MRILPVALITFGLACSCATTTKITSEPSGASVVDDATKKEIGKTPMTYESKMWIWESQKLTLKAAGHKDKQIELKRSDIDAMPTVGSVCLAFLPPCFLVQGGLVFAAGGMKFPEETKVKLDPAAPAADNDDVTKADKLCMRY